MLGRCGTTTPDAGLAADLGFPPAGDATWARIVDAGADSVELKVLVAPRTDPTSRLDGEHITRVRVRRLHLLDTPDLDLARRGVHVRLRDRGRDRWDLTVRARGEDPVPGGAPPGVRVELDVLPGVVFRSTEVRESHTADRALACRDGRVDVRELLTDAQAALLDGAVPDLGRGLVVHGPLTVERATVPRPRCGLAHARHERCRLAADRVLEEFSARCRPTEARATAEAVATFLAAHGFVPAPPHRTKTAAWADELRAVAARGI